MDLEREELELEARRRAMAAAETSDEPVETAVRRWLEAMAGDGAGDAVAAGGRGREPVVLPGAAADRKVLEGLARDDAGLVEQGLADGGNPELRVGGEGLLALAVRSANRSVHRRSAGLLLRYLPASAVTGREGEEAMQAAAETGDVGMIDLLRQHGAPAGRRNAAGELPFEVARKRGHAAAGDRLERLGAAEGGSGPEAPAGPGR